MPSAKKKYANCGHFAVKIGLQHFVNSLTKETVCTVAKVAYTFFAASSKKKDTTVCTQSHNYDALWKLWTLY